MPTTAPFRFILPEGFRPANSVRLVEPGEVRLADLVASLSTALDLTAGQPAGHCGRAALIALRLADWLGLDVEEHADLYFAVLLKDLGCSSNSSKMAYLFGADERAVKRDFKAIDWNKATASLKFTVRHAAPGASPIRKARHVASLTSKGADGVKQLIEIRCERGAEIARLIGLSQNSVAAIAALDEHWSGQGHPLGLRGDEIPLLGRIACLAQTVEVFFQRFGRRRALEVAHERSGRWFDPALVDVLARFDEADPLWDTLRGNGWRAALAAGFPVEETRTLDEGGIDTVCECFADVVDAKSPWTARHSKGVAELSVGIAEELGLGPAMRRDIRRAALLHDIGKLGVSNAILDKAGPPTDKEFAEIRRHPGYTQQILSPIPLFGRLADVAAAHHERPDGNGYHRRLDGSTMPDEARILAVADVYEALTAARPYRDATPVEMVDEIMTRDSGDGLDPECVAALRRWRDRAHVTPRVEVQMASIEQFHAEMA